ncbi:hypothetical protein T45_09136 [Streptomyces turgidiscabies]|nr:hypothetical protein T45_09136 [Streptomyces turgidiscabies]
MHKTGTAFTKPVDPILGQALGAWQAIRPEQPKFTDRRTGELVDLLFATRARKVFLRLHQQHRHPHALPQGWRPRRRCAWEHHQPPGPVHDRQPALQREGADGSVRTVSLARPPLAAVHAVAGIGRRATAAAAAACELLRRSAGVAGSGGETVLTNAVCRPWAEGRSVSAGSAMDGPVVPRVLPCFRDSVARSPRWVFLPEYSLYGFSLALRSSMQCSPGVGGLDPSGGQDRGRPVQVCLQIPTAGTMQRMSKTMMSAQASWPERAKDLGM